MKHDVDKPKFVPENVSRAVVAAQQAADVLQITDDESLEIAAATLIAIDTAEKNATTARTFLVAPLNKHVRDINAEFKPHTEGLGKARRTVKGKIATYKQKLDEQARREQARLDVERDATEQEVMRPQAPSLVVAAPMPTMSVGTNKVGTSERWTYDPDRVDIRALCGAVADGKMEPEAMSVNRSFMRNLLNATIRATGNPPEIPGVEFYKTTDVNIR